MDLATVIPLAIRASICLTVFSLGLGANLPDAFSLFRQPGLLIRSLLAMSVAMPIIVVGLEEVFSLRRPVMIALIALAVSPVPPILPKKLFKAGGSAPYVIGLLVSAALLAIVLIPGTIHLLGWILHRPLDVPPSDIARLALITVLIPLMAGMALRGIAPAFAGRIARPTGIVAAAMLALAAFPILIGTWRETVSLIGNGTVVVFAIFIAAGLAVGHLAGGPEPDNRSVLALATSTRHPGIAMTVAHAMFPDEKLVAPAIGLYLLLAVILTLPYVKWRQRTQTREVAK